MTLVLPGGMPSLRPYQAEIGQAVMKSFIDDLGLVFTVEIARQGGKNELSAQLEVLLLTRQMHHGGSAVKAAPTFTPQAVISMDRLKARLNDAGYYQWTVEHGHVIRLGEARQAFYSAEPSANVVGATANMLLEIDEAQDVDPDKYQKEFRPMAASANTTTVLYGTPWDGGTLLEQQKEANLELERRDGVRRHFRYDWRDVARHNRRYAAYVAAEEARLGADHPLFRTQYSLELLDSGRGFLSAQFRAWLRGDHPRRHRREDAAAYVAGIDVAGEAEGHGGRAEDDRLVRAREPRRDSTVVTIARLDFGRGNPVGSPRSRWWSTSGGRVATTATWWGSWRACWERPGAAAGSWWTRRELARDWPGCWSGCWAALSTNSFSPGQISQDWAMDYWQPGTGNV